MTNMRFEGLREIWHYRELLLFFAWRDLKVRYRRSVIGFLWTMLQPLLTMLVLMVAVAFSLLLLNAPSLAFIAIAVPPAQDGVSRKYCAATTFCALGRPMLPVALP